VTFALVLSEVEVIDIALVAVTFFALPGCRAAGLSGCQAVRLSLTCYVVGCRTLGDVCFHKAELGLAVVP
jgi:hypothetical protein